MKGIRHLYLFILFGILSSLPISAATNLLEGWDGNGDTNQNTSYPNNYGWNLTVGSFNYANASSGVRYIDVTSGHTYSGSTYSGRLLMVRWDGSGSTSLTSVYSYPVVLEANTRYQFSWIYEWWNNASSPELTVNISTDKAGNTAIASQVFACSSSKNVLLQSDFDFYVTEGQTYYITISANNIAALCAIGELSLTPTTSILESTSSSISLNHYQADKTIAIYPNGSTDSIFLSTPSSIELSPSALPKTGGSVTISSKDSTNLTDSIIIKQGSDSIAIDIEVSFPEDFFHLAKIDTLNIDGAWCWFNDPRAIYYEGTKKQTYFGWINSSGDIVVASYNHQTGVYTEHTLYEGLEIDDHDNPAIFIRKDGRLVVYFSKHTTAPAHRFISTNPEDITSWGDDYRFGENVTYPYPFQVDDQIYIFYRGLNWHPTLIISDDNGETLGEPQQFIAGGGARPYARYCQDSNGTIHAVFTTAHPRQDSKNMIYYAAFKDGKFYKADGTLIKSYTGTSTALNIDNDDMDTVYAATNGKGWIWDITVDKNNHPVMVYASFPSDTDHRYYYARWTGSEWFRTELCAAGGWFPQTPDGSSESEPNYSGGIYLDYDDPSIVYLSKEVNGVFEIFKYTTPDEGLTWKEQAITWNSPSDIVNVRPIVPRNHKKGYFDVLWMRGKYRYYQDYHTSIVFGMDSTVNRLDSIAISPNTIDITKSSSETLTVYYYPFISENKSVQWASSDANIVSVNNGTITGLTTGTATITATVPNTTIKATCTVTVNSPNYIGNAYFDFGTSTSPIINNGIGVTNTTIISDSYGWTNAVSSRDRGDASEEDVRDFNLSSSDATFKVFVEPGDYTITVTQGDYSFAHDQMNVYVNDVLKVSAAANTAGNFTTNTFDVNTTNDYLSFFFNDGGGSDANWVVNAIKIATKTSSSINEKRDQDITEGNIIVYDISGRIVFKEKLNGRTYSSIMNSKKLPTGIFFVHLDSETTSMTFKLLNQNKQ